VVRRDPGVSGLERVRRAARSVGAALGDDISPRGVN